MNFSLDCSFSDNYVLDPHAVVEAAGVDRLCDLRDRIVREFGRSAASELLERRDYLSFVLRDSVRKRERLWLFLMDETDIARWMEWLDADVVRQVGPRQVVNGEMVTPIGISPSELILLMTKRHTVADRRFLESALHDVDGLNFSRRAYKALVGVGIGVVQRSSLARALTNPRVLAYIVVFVYSALRAVPVTFVKQFHGSILMLWTIDLTTAIPYTWGVLTMFTAPRMRMRALGTVVAVVTFMLPYVYFGSRGRHYPPHVLMVIAVMILSTFIIEGFRFWLDRRVKRNLLSVQGRLPEVETVLHNATLDNANVSVSEACVPASESRVSPGQLTRDEPPEIPPGERAHQIRPE